MGFASDLLTGYQIGSGMRGKYDERKRRKGMQAALEGAQAPRAQTQQEQMLEEQTLGFDESDSSQWRPEAQDWLQAREAGAQKILDAGGSLEDVQAFQNHVDQKQRAGIDKFSSMAANALESGDIDAAAQYLERAHSYMDDGLRMQTANQDGQLLGFVKDETTNELVEVPIPITADMIRGQAQALLDSDAWMTFSEGKRRFDAQQKLRERKDKREEELHPGAKRLQDVKIAQGEGASYSAAGGTTGRGTGLGGWKNSELLSFQKEVTKQLDRYNEESPEFRNVPKGKEHLYGADNFHRTQGIVSSVGDVNVGISPASAIQAGEALSDVISQGPDAYNAFIENNIQPNPNSPSGFSFRVGKKDVNLPVELAPDGGQAAQAYAKKVGYTGPMVFKTREGAADQPWYREKYGLDKGQPQAPSQAVPRQAPPQQAVPQPTQPAPKPQSAVQPQQPAPEPAPGLAMPQEEQPRAAVGRGGSRARQRRRARAVEGAVEAIRDEILTEWYDPETDSFDMDLETIREYEQMLRGMRSQEADALRDLLKNLKPQRQTRRGMRVG